MCFWVIAFVSRLGIERVFYFVDCFPTNHPCWIINPVLCKNADNLSKKMFAQCANRQQRQRKDKTNQNRCSKSRHPRVSVCFSKKRCKYADEIGNGKHRKAENGKWNSAICSANFFAAYLLQVVFCHALTAFLLDCLFGDFLYENNHVSMCFIQIDIADLKVLTVTCDHTAV